MAQEQPEKVVQITLKDGLPVPEFDPVRVKKDNQKVKWSATFPFTIEIEDYNEVEHGSGNGTHHCKTGYFGEERKHKYSITANGKTNDPELDIKP